MKKSLRRFMRSGLCIVMAFIMAFQGTEPLLAYAVELIESKPRYVDFDRPEALTAEEAGISTEVETQETEMEMQETEHLETESISSESSEVELKEPEEYYPIPEEPQGELVHYTEDSRTYKTGDKEYTTVMGGYVGTYEDTDGEVKLSDNTLIESNSEEDVYENKENDYTIELPSEITEESGVKVTSEDYKLELVPIDGNYSNSVVKDNAILYNEIYPGVDAQYTVLDDDVKEDIILREKTDITSFTYSLEAPGLKAELIDNQVYLYPEDKQKEDVKYILEAPSMEDAAGEVSFNIQLDLIEKEDGSYLLTVTPDAD